MIRSVVAHCSRHWECKWDYGAPNNPALGGIGHKRGIAFQMFGNDLSMSALCFLIPIPF